MAACAGTTTSQSIAVGARDDAESTLLAHLYASALQTYGTAAHVEVVPDPLTGLDSGDIVVAPGFTGRLLDTFAPGAKARAAVQVYRDMVSALPEGVAAGDYAESAEDKPALAVTEATVDAWGGRDVTAAVRNCDKLKIGQVVGITAPGGDRDVRGQGARISRRRNPFRGAADRPGQRGVDVDGRSGHPRRRRWCWPTAQR